MASWDATNRKWVWEVLWYLWKKNPFIWQSLQARDTESDRDVDEEAMVFEWADCSDDWDRLSLFWSWEAKSLKPTFNLPASNNHEHACKIGHCKFCHVAVCAFKWLLTFTFCLGQDGVAPSRKAAHWDSLQTLIHLHTRSKEHERIKNINTIPSWAGQKWQRKTSAVLSRVGTIKRCAFVQQPPHPASCRLPWALHCTKRPQPGTLKISEDVRRDWSYTMIYRSKESEWEKCWISMALYSQCLQLAGTWTGRLWNQIRQGHWRRGRFIPNAWSCLCKQKGQIPNRRIMRKREVLQKHHRHDTVIQDDLPADRKSVLILLLACRLQTFSLCFHQLFQIKEHQTDMFHGCQIDRFRFHRWY